MAAHYGYPDPTQGQSPASFHPFLQEPRPTWPTQMVFERTHQSIHGFEGQFTHGPRSSSPQGAFGSPRMASGPGMEDLATRPSLLVERDASTVGLSNR
jgi:hypothetical protein